MTELIPRLTGNTKTFKCLPFLTKFFENSKEANKIPEPRILGLVSPNRSNHIQVKPNTSKNSKIKPKKSNPNQLPIYSRKDIDKIIGTGTYKKINLSNVQTNNTPLTSRKKISNNKLSNWKRPSYIINKENQANNKAKNDNINININITGYHSPNHYSKHNKNFHDKNLYIKTSNDSFNYNNKKIYQKKEIIEKNCQKSSMNSPNKYPVNISNKLYLKKTNINNANHKSSNSCYLSKEFTATSNKISNNNNDHFLKEQKYKIKKINIKNQQKKSHFHHNKTPENTYRNNSIHDSCFSSNYFSGKSNNNEEELSSSNNDNIVNSVLVSPKNCEFFNKNMEEELSEKNNDKDIKNIKCPEELHFFYVESLQKSKLLRFDSISKGTIEDKK